MTPLARARSTHALANDDGLTLAETLVAVVVLAVLIAVAIPVWSHQRARSVDAATTSDVRQVAEALASLPDTDGSDLMWSSVSAPAPPSLADIRLSPGTQAVVTANADGSWCVLGWNERGTMSSPESALWASSQSSGAVQRSSASGPCASTASAGGGGGAGGGIMPGGTYQKAIYSGGSVSLTNTLATDGADADVFVDGDMECNSQVSIDGSLLVTGDVYLTNTCRVAGSVRSGGNVTMDSSATVGGNVTAVGNIRQQSTSRIAGSAIAGGTYTVIDYPDATSTYTHSWPVQQGMVGVGVQEHAEATPPPSEAPTAQVWAPEWWPGFTTMTWRDWISDSAAANGAPEWSQAFLGVCSVAADSWSLNGPLRVTQDALVDARTSATGCSSVSLQGTDVELEADLTIFVTSMEVTNGLHLESADGLRHTVRILSPAGGSCSTSTISLVGEVGTAGVDLLVHTPGLLYVSGPVDVAGQLLAGCFDADGSVTVDYHQVTLPS